MAFLSLSLLQFPPLPSQDDRPQLPPALRPHIHIPSLRLPGLGQQITCWLLFNYGPEDCHVNSVTSYQFLGFGFAAQNKRLLDVQVTSLRMLWQGSCWNLGWLIQCPKDFLETLFFFFFSIPDWKKLFQWK